MQKRGIERGKHQSHYIARLQHLEDYSVFVMWRSGSNESGPFLRTWTM